VELAAPAPAPVKRSPVLEAAAASAESAPMDLDLGSAAGADADALVASADSAETVEVDADGCATKEGLVIVLRSLTDRISARRALLEQAVEAGSLEASDFERALGQAIPELEVEVNQHVRPRRARPTAARPAPPAPQTPPCDARRAHLPASRLPPPEPPPPQFGIDPEAVFKAQSKYQEEKEVVAVSRELRNAALPDFAAKAMGDMEDMMATEGTVPEGMTEQLVAQMTVDNATATIAKMKELVAEVKADGLSGSPALQAFQQRFVQRAKEFTLETFSALGVSPEDYAACMMKFVESPLVQTAHMETHQRLALCQQLNMMELTSGMSRADAIGALGIPAEAAAQL